MQIISNKKENILIYNGGIVTKISSVHVHAHDEHFLIKQFSFWTKSERFDAMCNIILKELTREQKIHSNTNVIMITELRKSIV